MTHKNVFTHIQVSTCYATYFHPDGYHSFETLRHDFDQAGPHVNTCASFHISLESRSHTTDS